MTSFFLYSRTGVRGSSASGSSVAVGYVTKLIAVEDMIFYPLLRRLGSRHMYGPLAMMYQSLEKTVCREGRTASPLHPSVLYQGCRLFRDTHFAPVICKSLAAFQANDVRFGTLLKFSRVYPYACTARNRKTGVPVRTTKQPVCQDRKHDQPSFAS